MMFASSLYVAALGSGLYLSGICAAALAADPTASKVFELDAGTEKESEWGTLNPDEMTLNKALKNAMRGKVDMMTCAQGYLMTKMGNHGDARTIFKHCAEQGYTGTMTWMSYMDDNGLGIEGEDAESAAEWDRKAAEAGDPIGQFNYGLDLLRGRGIRPDPGLGKQYIDRAATGGLKDAIELQGSNYDPAVVTPDADNWKYERLY
jgi:uncharacterized protein